MSSLSSAIYSTKRSLAGGTARFVGSISIADVSLQSIPLIYLIAEEFNV
jgi:hypothetical protein